MPLRCFAASDIGVSAHFHNPAGYLYAEAREAARHGRKWIVLLNDKVERWRRRRRRAGTLG